MSYDDWLTTPPANSSGCPHCGEKDDLSLDPATPADSGEDYGLDSDEATVVCLRCGWSGLERELMTDAEARLEAMLDRAGL